MAGVPYNPLMRASASQTERPKPNSIYEALQASARQATNDFNSSSFSQSMSNDVSAAANSIYAALMAPGDAMRGNLNSYEIDPNTGYTMNTGLMDAATNMAGIVQLGSLPMPRPSGSLGMGGLAKSAAEIEDLARARGVSLSLSESPGKISVGKIVVPDTMRSQGLGTELMQAIAQYADSVGKPVTLTPSSDFGGNVKRLERFYQSLGFGKNSGKSRDFSFQDSMVRYPK